MEGAGQDVGPRAAGTECPPYQPSRIRQRGRARSPLRAGGIAWRPGARESESVGQDAGLKAAGMQCPRPTCACPFFALKEQPGTAQGNALGKAIPHDQQP